MSNEFLGSKPNSMNRTIKKLFTFMFLVLLSTALIFSCGKQKEGDHPAGEHPSDSTEHPKDSTEHPTDSTEHPSEHPSEHPADSTKN